MSTKKVLRGALFLILVTLTVVGVLFAVQEYRYPHGRRGCTFRCMYAGMQQYALDHNGWYPRSDVGDLDALARLHPVNCSYSELAGVSGDVITTKRILYESNTLTEASTSWVYVQGFKSDSDPRLAILWEQKFGLFSDGKRNKQNQRAVLLLDGTVTNISQRDWDDFLKHQIVLRTTGNT